MRAGFNTFQGDTAMRTLIALACVGLASVATVAGTDRHGDPHLTFGPWSRPVSLGPIVNSAFHDLRSTISADGLSLYFTSDRPGGLGGYDMWVSRRLAIDLPWETPTNLGPTVNSPANDQNPNFSPDGRYLFFFSTRPGGAGLADLYMSRRIRSEGGEVWDTPVALSSLNSSAVDASPNYLASRHGRPQLFFTSTRSGQADIYVSELQRDGMWGPPGAVWELNAPGRNDGQPSIRADGLEIVFNSNRDGDGSQMDLYASHRDHLWEAWSIPEKIAGAVNTGGHEADPALSFDGRTLYFTVLTAEGHLDLQVSTRAALRRGRRDH
jgi:Tol biopolymer transport system component